MTTSDHSAEKLLGLAYAAMDAQTQKVASHIAGRKHIARNTATDLEDDTSFGARASDAVASFGGSWTFISLFATVLVVWVLINVVLLVRWSAVFDPYPFILLNLVLSCVAALQAPLIMMSQNRQEEKDRLLALLEK